MKKTNKFVEEDMTANPLFHDTWNLLKKFRDVRWSLELSVQQVKKSFEIEYGSSIDEFLDSIYLAGAGGKYSVFRFHVLSQPSCIDVSGRGEPGILRHPLSRYLFCYFPVCFFLRVNVKNNVPVLTASNMT